MDGIEALVGAMLEVAGPVDIVAPDHAIPGRIGQPEEGCAIGMAEKAAIVGNNERSVSIEWIRPGIGATGEGALLWVQIRIGSFRLPQAPMPRTRFIGAEPALPNSVSVPEGPNRKGLAGWATEFHRQLCILEGIIKKLCCGKRKFDQAMDMGCHWGAIFREIESFAASPEVQVGVLWVDASSATSFAK